MVPRSKFLFLESQAWRPFPHWALNHVFMNFTKCRVVRPLGNEKSSWSPFDFPLPHRSLFLLCYTNNAANYTVPMLSWVLPLTTVVSPTPPPFTPSPSSELHSRFPRVFLYPPNFVVTYNCSLYAFLRETKKEFLASRHWWILSFHFIFGSFLLYSSPRLVDSFLVRPSVRSSSPQFDRASAMIEMEP